MKRKRIVLKIAMLTTAFVLGISGITTTHNKQAKQLDATQYLSNYGSYTYSGTYYSKIDFNETGGMNGQLRKDISDLIYPKGFYTYGGTTGTSNLSTHLQKADEDPNNANNMIYFYSRDSVAKSEARVNNIDIWTREHVWPQSLSNEYWGTNEAGTDILHLRPVYPSANSGRGNMPFGNTNHQTPKVIDSTQIQYGYTQNGIFEPFDCVKGDIARIIMYTWTAYVDHYANMPSICIGDITKDVFESYDTLLQWHTQDKPDNLEGNRNNYCQNTSIQKNRNPFVDHPELAWEIFGSEVSQSVLNSCKEVYPLDGSTPGPGPSIETGEPVTVSKTMTEIFGNTTTTPDGTAKKENQLGNSVVSFSVTGSGSSGKVYSSGTTREWRLYQSENPTFIVSVPDGYFIQSVKVTYNPNNNGVLVYDGQSISSGTSVAIDPISETLSFSIGNSGTATNGQVRVTAISVTYVPIVENIALTDISLNKSQLTLEIGESETLIVSPVPSDAELGAVTWQSSDETVATVDGGEVTAVSGGTATITAYAGGFSTSCTVTVSSGSQTGDTVTITLDYLAMTTGGVLTTAGEQTFNKNGLTFVISNGAANSNNSDVRVYKNATITFTAEEITRIAFTCSNSNPSTNFTSFTGFNNSTGVWTGSTQSVYFTASEGQVRITKIVITYVTSTPIQQEDSPDDYLESATTYATVHGKELGTSSSILTFADRSYANAESLNDVSIDVDSSVFITFSKGSGSTNPSYYTDSASLRAYGGNTITVSTNDSNKKIIRIDFTTVSSGGAYDMSKFTASAQKLSGNVWNGENNSVTFTNGESSGHARIASIKVIYYENAQSYSVASVGMRFGASIAKSYWDSINANSEWEITDYGVMMVKQTTLQGYGKTSVEAAYRAGKNVTISNKLKDGEYADPYLVGGVYSFTARLSSIPSTDYNTNVCAAPFIVVKDAENHEEYYFLTETTKSVKELAQYCSLNGGSNLSDKALGILAA